MDQGGGGGRWSSEDYTRTSDDAGRPSAFACRITPVRGWKAVPWMVVGMDRLDGRSSRPLLEDVGGVGRWRAQRLTGAEVPGVVVEVPAGDDGRGSPVKSRC